MKETIDYNFKCIDLSDYEIILKMKSKGSVFDKIFNKSREKLVRMGKKQFSKINYKNIEEFEIPENYYNLLTTIIKKTLKQIKKEVAKDKIIVMNERVTKANFKKNNNSWNIKLKVSGQYVDKR